MRHKIKRIPRSADRVIEQFNFNGTDSYQREAFKSAWPMVKQLLSKCGITAAAVVFLTGCSLTVIPKRSEPLQASIDGNQANSGVKSFIPGVGYVVSEKWHTQYVELLKNYGEKLAVPRSGDFGCLKQADGTYLATIEAVNDFGDMADMKRGNLK